MYNTKGAMCMCLYKSMLDKPWYPGVSRNDKPDYQTVLDFPYWLVLVSFNNWNSIILNNKGI